MISNKVSGMAIAGFILSLFSLICCCVPACPILLSILALVFSIIGIRNTTKKGLGIAGIVISSIVIVLSIITTILTFIDGSPVYEFWNAFMEGFWEGATAYSTIIF